MKFRFSIDPDGELDGNDASQEHFAGHRLTSVAREIGQNSNDARSKTAKKEGKPAIVYFEKISVPPKHIPDLQGLKEKLEGSLDYATRHLKNKDYEDFYTKALKVLGRTHIPVLKVSDWNTTGLEGPFKGTTPVVAFAKGKGISQKSSMSAGGSRGIGKNAILTISDLRTSFFSTFSINRDTNKSEYLSQGKSVLISDIKEGKIRKGTGYCGNPDATAVRGESALPDWLKRSADTPGDAVDQRGLTLFALGFNQGQDWYLKLSASAITTFFSAIQQGLLEFRIHDSSKKIIISRQTFFGFFDDPSILESLDPEEVRQLGKSKIYANILRCAEEEPTEVAVEYFENPKLGKFRLCIQVQEGMPRTVALIRTGMLITESMPLLKRFSGKDFAATLQAETEKGLEFLRSLEGAEHNALEPDRIEDKDQRAKATKTLNEITKRARELIEKHIRIESEDTDDIDELAKFFPYEMGEEAGDSEKKELNPLGNLRLVPNPPRKFGLNTKRPENENQAVDSNTGSEGTESGSGHGGKGTGQGSGPGDGDGASTNQSKAKEPVPLANIRAPIIAPKKTARKLSFTVGKAGNVALSLFVAGADEDYPLQVKESSIGQVRDGKVFLDNVKQDQRLCADIKLTEVFEGALKVFAYKVSEEEENV